MTEVQWEAFHIFLLGLYRLEDIHKIQRYVMDYLGKAIPHRRSMFDFGTVKKDAIYFFGPYSDNIPETELKTYYNNYQQKDYTTWNFSPDKTVIYRDSELMPDASREKSRIYQEWMQPLDAYYGLGCTLVQEIFYGSITMFRPKSEMDFNDEEYHLLEKVSQHLASHLHLLFPKGIREQDFNNEETLFQKYHLTPREQEIAKLAANGFANQEIAGELCISETTVKKHMGHIFEKMNLKSRKQLILICSS